MQLFTKTVHRRLCQHGSETVCIELHAAHVNAQYAAGQQYTAFVKLCSGTALPVQAVTGAKKRSAQAQRGQNKDDPG